MALVAYAIASLPGEPLAHRAWSPDQAEDGETFTEVVVNEARRIVGELARPTSLSEISGHLIRSLGPDARQTRAELGTFKAFLAYAVPSAQIVTDRPPGWVIPAGVPLDHPLPDPRSAAPLVDDDPALMVVADEVRQIVGEFTRPATLTEVSALLTRSLGDDAKQARDKFKSFKAFLEYAAPTSQIVGHSRHKWWFSPRAFRPNSPFLTPGSQHRWSTTIQLSQRRWPRKLAGSLVNSRAPRRSKSFPAALLGRWARTRSDMDQVQDLQGIPCPRRAERSDPDGPPSRVGVSRGRAPRPSAPRIMVRSTRVVDDEALTEIVASETRRIVGRTHRRGTAEGNFHKLDQVFGPGSKRAWAKPKNFKTFLARAAPTAQIFSDGAGWVVPEGASPEPPLLEPWLPPTCRSRRGWSMTIRHSRRWWPMKHAGSSANSRALLRSRRSMRA